MPDAKKIDGLTPKTMSQVMGAFKMLHASGKLDDAIRELEEHGVHFYVEHDKLHALGGVLTRISDEHTARLMAAGLRPGPDEIHVPC